jgi:hypothetical protein
MTQVKPRTALENARVGFGKSRVEAATRLGVTEEWIRQVEKGLVSGVGPNKVIIELCNWYRLLAADHDYDYPMQFHQTALCPDDFPSTVAVKTEEPN